MYFLMFLEGSILILLIFCGVQFLINKFQLIKPNIIQEIFAPVTDLHTVLLKKSLSIKKMVLWWLKACGIYSSIWLYFMHYHKSLIRNTWFSDLN